MKQPKIYESLEHERKWREHIESLRLKKKMDESYVNGYRKGFNLGLRRGASEFIKCEQELERYIKYREY